MTHLFTVQRESKVQLVICRIGIALDDYSDSRWVAIDYKQLLKARVARAMRATVRILVALLGMECVSHMCEIRNARNSLLYRARVSGAFLRL